jgi:predicted glycosyltransferase
MRYHFYLAHPAHFHLFLNTIVGLRGKGHEVSISIKSKDVLEKLLIESGLEYVNISSAERKPGSLAAIIAMIKRNWYHLNLFSGKKPDVFISTSAEFAPLGRMLGIRCVSMFEDDLELFPVYSRVFVPFLNHQLCPAACSAGQWDKHPKTIHYAGNHELAYLRPNRFQADKSRIQHCISGNNKTFLIRFSRLDAWHDDGVKGIDNSLARKLIAMLQNHGRVWISSERPLPAELEPLRLQIPASDILHLVAHCDLYIGDSQTMTAEAAVLGTPAIRFNDFVGKIGYLGELEHRFGLCFSFRTDQADEMLACAERLATSDNIKSEWETKRSAMLNETIDPTDLFVHFLDNYPTFVKESKQLYTSPQASA